MLSQLTQAFKQEQHKPFFWPGGYQAALLIHGFPGTPAEMHPLAMVLHEAGWTVSAPLLPGFGMEIERLHDHSHTDWIHAIEQQYLQLKERHDRVIVVGYSLGGAIALNVAGRHTVDGLILLAPFWQIDTFLWQMLPFVKHILPKIKPFKMLGTDLDNQDVRDGIAHFIPGIDLNDPTVQHEIHEFTLPMRMIDELRITGKKGYEAAEHIQSPVLLLQGVHDELVNARLTRQILVKLGGSVTYMEIEAAHDLLNPASKAWTGIQHAIIEFAQPLKVGRH